MKMIKYLFLALITLILFGCSTLQQTETNGEYRYMPITERLKALSNEDFQASLRTASLVCENDMLRVAVPSRVIDEAGWEAGQNERRRYFRNCMELKGFERRFLTPKDIKREEANKLRDFRNEDYLEKPRFY